MGSDEERMARLWQLPLEVVPYHCEPSWVAALAHDADLAAQVGTRRGATGLP